jgi:ATP/maltotriose-dependent transcriptional regulator MalT
VSREAGDRVNESLCLANLGEMAFLDGDLTRARELLTQAAALAGEVADPSNRSFVRVDSFARIDLGWVHLAEGDIEEGERRFREGLALERELGTSTGARSALAGLAGLAAARGDHERAARLSGAAEALAEQADATPDASDLRAHEPLLSTARAAAGDRWEPWVLEGRRMSLDDACDLALNMRRSAP